VVGEGRLDDLPLLVDLARSLRGKLRQNAALAVIYNAAVIPAAALGVITPSQAAGLMLVETLLVLANAARLLRAPMRAPSLAASPPFGVQPPQAAPAAAGS
jgi:cation transport ATPase